MGNAKPKRRGGNLPSDTCLLSWRRSPLSLWERGPGGEVPPSPVLRFRLPQLGQHPIVEAADMLFGADVEAAVLVGARLHAQLHPLADFPVLTVGDVERLD